MALRREQSDLVTGWPCGESQLAVRAEAPQPRVFGATGALAKCIDPSTVGPPNSFVPRYYARLARLKLDVGVNDWGEVF